MQHLKITLDNITHKFTNIPQSFEDLDQLIQKSMGKSLQQNTLYFQNTPVQCQDDYRFLLKLESNIKLSLKPSLPQRTLRSKSQIKSQKKNQLYYLNFNEQDIAQVENNLRQFKLGNLRFSQKRLEKPRFDKQTSPIPCRKIKNSINYKGYFTELCETQVNIVPGSTKLITLSVFNSGCEQWPEQVFLYSTSGITMGQTHQIESLKCGQIGNFQIPIKMPNQQGEYQSVWRIMYYQNGVRKCFGPKILLSAKHELDIDCQVGKILAKAQEVKQILGGQVIHYVRFIRENGLQGDCVKNIIEKIIQDPLF